MNCELCEPKGEKVIWQGPNCRVILADEIDFPGFCRVIWHHHVKEMTDLTLEMRAELMNIVFIVENAVREVMQPQKINLASLGNMTPHLHWHVIPRYADDTHFPNPIWANSVRSPRISNISDIQNRLTKAILKRITH